MVSHTSQATDDEKAIALESVAHLIQALDQHGVRYCHWKSNFRLELGLSGRTDLDLLVDREHSQTFRQLLEDHNVKPVLAPPGKRYPGIENYLGFDPTTGRLFHLHVHYQLVLGEQFVKNYCLPLEDVFLDSVRLQHGVKVPTPELELIVLSLRALLKYRDRDALKDILSIRSPGIPAHITDEVHWLLEQTSIQAVSNAIADISAVVPRDVVLEFLETVIDSPRDGYKLYRLRQRVRRALSENQRHERLYAAAQYFYEMWRRGFFSRFTRSKGFTLPGGGLTVALVGVDGAGKTTLCRALSKWLTEIMDVHLYYLGSKQPSRLSEWLYLLFRIARRGHRSVSAVLGESSIFARAIASTRQVLLYSHYLSIGYDRYRRYVLGRSKAMAGSVVIFDRFPLEAPLDGPEIHLVSNGHAGGAASVYSRWEGALYRRFEMPDLLVVLDVSPGVSIQRKPDHREEAIEAKNRALRSLRAALDADPSQRDWAYLNAERPFESVLNQLKKAIWAAF